ncbi:MAG: hypothetical protein N2053_09730, partial [Chitinispirillaceae bacterium]|nr:hypothetical protein [Chitinispirillaceae bacterium]
DKSVSDKNITIIQSQTSADGKTNVSESLLEECIESLPDPSSLEPVITSEAKYLKEINGDPNKNDFVKTYTATLEINYMLKHRNQ